MNDVLNNIASVRFASRFFRIVNSLRTRFGVELDEIIIFFALGRLNYDLSHEPTVPVKPVPVTSLCGFLQLPRETLRRKLLRLEEKGLIYRSSYGYLIKDVAIWQRLADVHLVADENSVYE